MIADKDAAARVREKSRNTSADASSSNTGTRDVLEMKHVPPLTKKDAIRRAIFLETMLLKRLKTQLEKQNYIMKIFVKNYKTQK